MSWTAPRCPIDDRHAVIRRRRQPGIALSALKLHDVASADELSQPAAGDCEREVPVAQRALRVSYRPQQRLYLLPEPHGQGWLRVGAWTLIRCAGPLPVRKS